MKMKRKRKNACSSPLLDESPKRPKVHAQRKFAQGSNVNSPVITPIRELESESPKTDVLPEPVELLPIKRPNTEDFLTFLCFRGTPILPPSLNFFNTASIVDTNGQVHEIKSEASSKNGPIDIAKCGTSSEKPFVAFGVRKRADPVVISRQMDRKRRHALALQALRRKYQEQKMAKIRALTIRKLSEKVTNKTLVRTNTVSKTETITKKTNTVQKTKVVATKHIKVTTRTLKTTLKPKLKQNMCLRSFRGRFIQQELPFRKKIGQDTQVRISATERRAEIRKRNKESRKVLKQNQVSSSKEAKPLRRKIVKNIVATPGPVGSRLTRSSLTNTKSDLMRKQIKRILIPNPNAIIKTKPRSLRLTTVKKSVLSRRKSNSTKLKQKVRAGQKQQSAVSDEVNRTEKVETESTPKRSPLSSKGDAKQVVERKDIKQTINKNMESRETSKSTDIKKDFKKVINVKKEVRKVSDRDKRHLTRSLDLKKEVNKLTDIKTKPHLTVEIKKSKRVSNIVHKKFNASRNSSKNVEAEKDTSPDKISTHEKQRRSARKSDSATKLNTSPEETSTEEFIKSGTHEKRKEVVNSTLSSKKGKHKTIGRTSVKDDQPEQFSTPKNVKSMKKTKEKSIEINDISDEQNIQQEKTSSIIRKSKKAKHKEEDKETPDISVGNIETDISKEIANITEQKIKIRAAYVENDVLIQNQGNKESDKMDNVSNIGEFVSNSEPSVNKHEELVYNKDGDQETKEEDPEVMVSTLQVATEVKNLDGLEGKAPSNTNKVAVDTEKTAGESKETKKIEIGSSPKKVITNTVESDVESEVKPKEKEENKIETVVTRKTSICIRKEKEVIKEAVISCLEDAADSLQKVTKSDVNEGVKEQLNKTNSAEQEHSITRSQRSRKTNEAAALYADVTTDILDNDNKIDDDIISIDSFPELPNLNIGEEDAHEEDNEKSKEKEHNKVGAVASRRNSTPVHKEKEVVKEIIVTNEDAVGSSKKLAKAKRDAKNNVNEQLKTKCDQEETVAIRSPRPSRKTKEAAAVYMEMQLRKLGSDSKTDDVISIDSSPELPDMKSVEEDTEQKENDEKPKEKELSKLETVVPGHAFEDKEKVVKEIVVYNQDVKYSSKKTSEDKRDSDNDINEQLKIKAEQENSTSRSQRLRKTKEADAIYIDMLSPKLDNDNKIDDETISIDSSPELPDVIIVEEVAEQKINEKPKKDGQHKTDTVAATKTLSPLHKEKEVIKGVMVASQEDVSKSSKTTKSKRDVKKGVKEQLNKIKSNQQEQYGIRSQIPRKTKEAAAINMEMLSRRLDNDNKIDDDIISIDSLSEVSDVKIVEEDAEEDNEKPKQMRQNIVDNLVIRKTSTSVHKETKVIQEVSVSNQEDVNQSSKTATKAKIDSPRDIKEQLDKRKSDQEVCSTTKSQRPSRKTKEAASIYMEMLSRKSDNDNDIDDDPISLDSFTEVLDENIVEEDTEEKNSEKSKENEKNKVITKKTSTSLHNEKEFIKQTVTNQEDVGESSKKTAKAKRDAKKELKEQLLKTKSDQEENSITRSQRPSRKTKEAAAMYLEMLSRKLDSDNQIDDDDDDAISIDSFPELSNLKIVEGDAEEKYNQKSQQKEQSKVNTIKISTSLNKEKQVDRETIATNQEDVSKSSKKVTKVKRDTRKDVKEQLNKTKSDPEENFNSRFPRPSRKTKESAAINVEMLSRKLDNENQIDDDAISIDSYPELSELKIVEEDADENDNKQSVGKERNEADTVVTEKIFTALNKENEVIKEAVTNHEDVGESSKKTTKGKRDTKKDTKEQLNSARSSQEENSNTRSQRPSRKTKEAALIIMETLSRKLDDENQVCDDAISIDSYPELSDLKIVEEDADEKYNEEKPEETVHSQVDTVDTNKIPTPVNKEKEGITETLVTKTEDVCESSTKATKAKRDTKKDMKEQFNKSKYGQEQNSRFQRSSRKIKEAAAINSEISSHKLDHENQICDDAISVDSYPELSELKIVEEYADENEYNEEKSEETEQSKLDTVGTKKISTFVNKEKDVIKETVVTKPEDVCESLTKASKAKRNTKKDVKEQSNTAKSGQEENSNSRSQRPSRKTKEAAAINMEMLSRELDNDNQIDDTAISIDSYPELSELKIVEEDADEKDNEQSNEEQSKLDTVGTKNISTLNKEKEVIKETIVTKLEDVCESSKKATKAKRDTKKDIKEQLNTAESVQEESSNTRSQRPRKTKEAAAINMEMLSRKLDDKNQIDDDTISIDSYPKLSDLKIVEEDAHEKGNEKSKEKEQSKVDNLGRTEISTSLNKEKEAIKEPVLTKPEDVCESSNKATKAKRDAKKDIKEQLKTKSDHEGNSVIRSQRPSRKTKEAAAIYMEILSHKLVNDNKIDDETDSDSFPELPNVKRTEQREIELKAKAKTSKDGNKDKSKSKNIDIEDKTESTETGVQVIELKNNRDIQAEDEKETCANKEAVEEFVDGSEKDINIPSELVITKMKKRGNIKVNKRKALHGNPDSSEEELIKPKLRKSDISEIPEAEEVTKPKLRKSDTSHTPEVIAEETSKSDLRNSDISKTSGIVEEIIKPRLRKSDSKASEVVEESKTRRLTRHSLYANRSEDYDSDESFHINVKVPRKKKNTRSRVSPRPSKGVKQVNMSSSESDRSTTSDINIQTTINKVKHKKFSKTKSMKKSDNFSDTDEDETLLKSEAHSQRSSNKPEKPKENVKEAGKSKKLLNKSNELGQKSPNKGEKSKSKPTPKSSEPECTKIEPKPKRECAKLPQNYLPMFSSSDEDEIFHGFDEKNAKNTKTCETACSHAPPLLDLLNKDLGRRFGKEKVNMSNEQIEKWLKDAALAGSSIKKENDEMLKFGERIPTETSLEVAETIDTEKLKQSLAELGNPQDDEKVEKNESVENAPAKTDIISKIADSGKPQLDRKLIFRKNKIHSTPNVNAFSPENESSVYAFGEENEDIISTPFRRPSRRPSSTATSKSEDESSKHDESSKTNQFRKPTSKQETLKGPAKDEPELGLEVEDNPQFYVPQNPTMKSTLLKNQNKPLFKSKSSEKLPDIDEFKYKIPSSPSASSSSSAKLYKRQPQKQKTRSADFISPVYVSDFPRPTEPAKLVEAPVFHPTDQEFQDPLEYIERIRHKAEQFGICRIVPPSSFKPECKVTDDMRFTAYNQYVNKMLYRWGPNFKELMAIKKYLETQNIALNHPPWIGGMEIDLPRLYQIVQTLGGLREVIEKKKWSKVSDLMKIPKSAQDRVTKLDDIYCKYLLPYDILSPAEREKLFDEVETEWAKKESRILMKTQDQKSNTGNANEAESDIEENDTEECITKGRNMALNAFYRIARNTMSMYFKTTEPLPQEVEQEYWKYVTMRQNHICVHSGSIDCGNWGYGFAVAKNSPFARHPWNLKVLTNNGGSVLRCLGPLMGVTVPTLHVGMVFSACCWYRDPHGLPWIEYLHTGGSKIWYGIPNSAGEQFHTALKKLAPNYCKNKELWLPSDTVMVPPNLLVENQVSLCHTVQEPGQFVVVFPKAFTSSISTGYVVSESVYFAPIYWLKTARNLFDALRQSNEPAMFSFDRLLLNVVNDPKCNIEIVRQVLPLLQELCSREMEKREKLYSLGEATREKLPIPEVNRGKKKKFQQGEEGDYECEICRSSLFLSMIFDTVEGITYCLNHSTEMIEKKELELTNCKFMFTYDDEEVKALPDRMKTALDTRLQKKIPNKFAGMPTLLGK